ncbi:MAG: phosphate/phosphite/phosphonate ABC transporter substrate-binding protein [Ardenticatenaceae bacterium]
MKRKIFVLCTLLLLALAVVACGGATTPEEPAGEPEVEEPIVDEPTEAMAEEPTEEMMEEPTEEMMEEPTEEMMEEPTEEAMEEPTEEAAGGAAGDLGTADNPIIMSFVPSGDTQEIIASGEEIAAMIEERTGLTVEANVATSYSAVVTAMCEGNAPVGWLNTFSYIVAHEQCGVDVGLATVRFGEPFYTGQIIANADAGITELADVEGHTICWVDQFSTSGYIIPRVMLAAEGVDVDALEATEAGSHPNVVTAVYNGDCDAGATFVDARTAIAEEFPDVNEKVVVVAESPEIPNDTVSFAPDVPEEIREQIVTALQDIAGTEEGAAALDQVYEIEGFEEVDDSFYDEFRTVLDASGIDVAELAGE